MSSSFDFGERIVNGDRKTILNTPVSGSNYPAITNREFTEVESYIENNSQDGASDLVYGHLVALFNTNPKKKINENNPNVCTLTIIPTGKYNKDIFTTHINQAVSFGYTIVEQDSPLRSWKIYYMSLGPNVYCATYSTTYKRITVTSRV